jgi:hypothetical protein
VVQDNASPPSNIAPEAKPRGKCLNCIAQEAEQCVKARIMDSSYEVCISPLKDGWAVGFGKDYRSSPLQREEAILQAFRIAVEAKVAGVAMLNEAGSEIGWLPVDL